MWRIDRDYIARKGDVTRVGVTGGNSLPDPRKQIRFRLLDDDREVYYGGWMNDDDDCANQLSALEFGILDAGACIVEVKRNGEWVQEIG